MSATEYTSAEALEHEAFVHSSDDEYVEVLVPLVRAALAAGDAVHVVVPDRKAALLRDSLGDAAGELTWIDAAQWYRHPARTVAGYDRTLRHLPPGRSALVIGEVDFGATRREWAEWTRYESVLNHVLQRHAVRVICPYDERSLPRSVIAAAARTHPHVLGRDARALSDHYGAPEDLLLGIVPTPTIPDRAPDLGLVDATSVRTGRRLFVEAAERAGLVPDAIHELVVGVSEVLTNAIVHGGGHTAMRLWVGVGADRLVCVIEDSGEGIDDPMLGFRAPPKGSQGGYGLWYTRQVFDRCEVSRSPLGGLLVHLVVNG